jgi:hypothetical protein
MSRRRRAGMLSRVFAFLLASFANVSVGGRHTTLEPLPNGAPAPVMSKHWPLMVTVRAAVAVVAIAAAFLVATTFAGAEDALAGMHF